MMLRMNNDGNDYGSWEGGSYLADEEDDFDDPNDESELDADDGEPYDGTDIVDEVDAFDVHVHEVAGEDHNPALEFDLDVFSSDEAYARALQDAEEREMAARMLALSGINDRACFTSREVGDADDRGGHLPDTWEEVDPDELSYEELLALGEVVGSESRGLSADTIASLPSINYTAGGAQHGSSDSCVICRLDYEDGETLTVLSCKHSYHSECINNWLKINKVECNYKLDPRTLIFSK
ncbi:E3 ubiquitin ligase BIG BROTHER-related-like isoform X1 [Punica granatum]|uniref:E3 ubiquitin ligase BIG BROTHER-related-like isoform X1 n=1 Tax=Punica granatum TaxID=22663 RepID=A0A6P8C010_PUNGR|nr:E3 ubiquitin ligase BIG BROTHER-related-like isoform X1 [Punica granatum]